MRILHLTLKKKWFDMIASGIKKEEYREIKPYWNKRPHYRGAERRENAELRRFIASNAFSLYVRG